MSRLETKWSRNEPTTTIMPEVTVEHLYIIQVYNIQITATVVLESLYPGLPFFILMYTANIIHTYIKPFLYLFFILYKMEPSWRSLG